MEKEAIVESYFYSRLQQVQNPWRALSLMTVYGPEKARLG